MQKTDKKKKGSLAALVLMFIFNGITTHAVAQQVSWNAMADIRQVTQLASVTRWEIIKQINGVTLSSRWLTFGDTLKTREIELHFEVDAEIDRVLVHLSDPEKMKAWNDGVRSLELLAHKDKTWITHTVYDIPYPFAQQDLVVRHALIRENQKAIVLLSALPGYIKPLINVNRQQLYFGKWELTAPDNTTTEVKFSVLSFSKSGIPRFIRDPIIQKKLLNSFSMLKQFSSHRSPAVAEQSAVLSVPSAIIR